MNEKVKECIEKSDKFFVQLADSNDDKLRFARIDKLEAVNLLKERGVWTVEYIASLWACTLVPRYENDAELSIYKPASQHSIIA